MQRALWVTNIDFYVFKTNQQLLGQPPISSDDEDDASSDEEGAAATVRILQRKQTEAEIYEQLKSNKGVCLLWNNRQTGQRYTDNLCFFRALAAHQNYRAAGENAVFSSRTMANFTEKKPSHFWRCMPQPYNSVQNIGIPSIFQVWLWKTWTCWNNYSK